MIDIESCTSNNTGGLHNKQRPAGTCLKWLKDCGMIMLEETLIQAMWTYLYSSMVYLIYPPSKLFQFRNS